MNFKTTGLLGALLIIVIGVWLLVGRSQPPQADALDTPAAPDTEQYVFDPQPQRDTIVRLTIEPAGKPRLVFQRSPKPDQPEQMGNWRAVEPLAVPVESYRLNNLVSTFASLRSRTQFAGEAQTALSAADAGLSPPGATVTLTDNDGKQYKVEVGQRAAMSTDTYVRAAGQKIIHVVTRDLLAEVKKDFKEYRDKKLCPLTTTDAVRVAINADGKSYLLSRGEDDAWVIDKPVKAYAEGDEVRALLGRIRALRAQEFVDDAPASLVRYGLDSPEMTITVTTETKRALPAEEDESTTQPAEPEYETITETYALAIGGFADLKQERRYASVEGWPGVVSVKQDDVERVIPDLVKLRDPQITRVAAGDATRLELTAEGTTVTLEKVDDRWQGSGELSELETAAVVDLLEAFEDLTAIDYVLAPGDLAAYGLDQPRATVTVTAGGVVAPVTLRIGDVTKSARNAYVLREGQPTVFVVSAAQAKRLAVPPLSLRSRRIFAANEQLIRRVEVLRGPARYVLERDEDEWQMTAPAGAPVEPTSVRMLVSDLAHLRARRVVGRNEDARFGIDNPVMTVRFAVHAPGPPADTQPTTTQATPLVEHTLRVGRKDTVAYCRIDDNPYVFELDETVFRLLSGELIDRKLFSFRAEDIVRLMVVAPGGTLELAKQGEQWKFTPDPFVKLSQKKVAELLDELAALSVESYLQYRDADLAATGLFTAPVTISIKLAAGALVNLKMEQERPGELPRLAGWVEQKRTFRLSPADCEKLLRGLDHYLEPQTGQD